MQRSEVYALLDQVRDARQSLWGQAQMTRDARTRDAVRALREALVDVETAGHALIRALAGAPPG